jgi:hypothetical protein
MGAFDDWVNRGGTNMTGGGGGGGNNRGPGMNRGGRPNHGGGTPGMGGGGKPKRKKKNAGDLTPDGPLAGDDYTLDFYNTNPQQGFNHSMTNLGFNMGQGDAFSNWLNRQYESAYADYQGLTADPANQNLRWDQHLAGLGDKNAWINKYNLDTLANKGLTYAPYEGQSRWLAF